MEYKIQIREMQKTDLSPAVEVIGKAYATNPEILAIYGGNSTAALRMKIAIKSTFKYLPGSVFVAELDGLVVGGMRIVGWPACQASNIKMVPSMVASARGLGPLVRAMKWQGAWKKHDPGKPHWHLSVLGVTPELQGKGFGSQMMQFYCDIIDRDRIEAYHETDRPDQGGPAGWREYRGPPRPLLNVPPEGRTASEKRSPWYYPCPAYPGRFP